MHQTIIASIGKLEDCLAVASAAANGNSNVETWQSMRRKIKRRITAGLGSSNAVFQIVVLQLLFCICVLHLSSCKSKKSEQL